MKATALALGLTLAACSSAVEDAAPSFILISLDTLRADRIGALGGPSGLTPNLDRFAAESAVFTQTFAQSSETLFSHASLFTSRYPSELGPVDYTFSFPLDVPTLAEVLSLYGYATGAAVGGGHISPLFGLHRGFSSYQSPREWGSLWHTAPAALDWMDTVSDQPFFLFLHGYDAHSRYLKPSPVGQLYTDTQVGRRAQRLVQDLHGTAQLADGWWYRRRRFPDIFDLGAIRPWSPEARAELKARKLPNRVPIRPAVEDYIRQVYDGAVTYADVQFGLWMAALADRDLLDHTWIIVLADHGEELGEDGLFNHRLTLSEPVLQVPLMIRPPGGLTEGLRIERLTALVDVMPTIIELAGAKPPAPIRGQSLVPALQGQPMPPRSAVFAEGVFREVAVRTATGGLCFSGLSAHSPYLRTALAETPTDSIAFRSWKSVDRGEAASALQAWRASLPPSPASITETDPARLEVLRKQGYWGPR